MKTKLLPMRQVTQALALAGLVSVADHVGAAVNIYLCAKPVSLGVPGGGTVPMWGFAPDNATGDCSQPATVPGPGISIPANETALNVYLKNTLTTPVSIVINGQSLPAITGAEPVWTDSSSGKRFVDQQNPTPAELAKRVRSLVHETAPGTTGVYNFSGVKPGTYLYQSGTHPQVQVQMGLYGGVMKDFAAGQVYAGVTYSNEVTLLYSEVDPSLHALVSGGTYDPAMNSTLNYQPKYFLINGKAFVKPVAGDPPVPALATLTAGQSTLLRFLNAGLQTRVPVINGMSMRLIAEDGNPYPWPANPREQYSVLLPAAKTIDAIIVPQAVAGETKTRYPIYDRRMGLSNNGASDGGMLAFLDVGGGGSAPAFTSTPVTTATQNAAYTYTLAASDTDGGGLSYSLDVKPTGMSVNAGTGVISWTPSSAQIGTQAVTARVTDPTGLFATQPFSIVVADANDPPVAQNNAYTMIRRGTLNVAAPGILSNDSDPDAGDTLSAVSFGALTPTGGTLVRNADGSFSFTPPLAYTGTKSFTYRARDSSLATSNVATVAITVIANRPPLAVDDTVAVPVRRSTPPYVPVVINVLANDSDPDTAIDPANVINPASVTISSAPNKGGSVVVNSDGTLAYTPKLNFRGTETFRYRVQDSYITPATSNAAYVRVNVQ